MLTTYDVLRLDLNRQPQLVENRQLRGKKKYEVSTGVSSSECAHVLMTACRYHFA